VFGGTLTEQLIQLNAAALQERGYSRQEAIKSARESVDRAKEIVRERNQQNEPANYGDVMLEREGSDAAVDERLRYVLAHGGTREDFRGWWNQSPLERTMSELDDEVRRVAMYLEGLRRNEDPNEVLTRVWRFHPKFGEPGQAGDPAPLPIELKDRINRYIEQQASNLEAYRSKLESSPSFNALIRLEIRSGNL
jgi:hypothetical protein